MNSWRLFFYYFIGGAALILSVLGLWFIYIMPNIERWSKRFFQNFFKILLLTSISALLEMILRGYHAPNQVIGFVIILECIFMSLLLPMLTVYLLHCSEENTRTSKLLQIVSGLWLLYVIMLVCSAFFADITLEAPNMQYYRGLWYSLTLMPLVAVQLLNIAATIQRRKKLSRKTYLRFLIALLPITISLIIQMFVDVLPILDITLTISTLSMYGLVLSDQIEKDLQHQREITRQQQEIANQKASIMVLQMRPHFIYNTMTSIYCLCGQDPEKARQVIMDFTTYLRKNFTAIASPDLIPFSAELEHVRAYLAVEQAQYEDSLSVDYDTPHTWFRIPSLTLQPIVENAVKHGRDPYAGPFHISIRTRKTNSGSEIIVADNGRGLLPSDNEEPHIALKNIEERLEIMCGGSLTITPGDGSGTVVKLTIPDSAPQ